MGIVGLITIGQSPREDVVASMFDSQPAMELVEAGALDDLGAREIAELSPRGGELPLVTRLRDGSEVVVGEDRLVPHLQRALERVLAEGATLVVVLCTGEFPALRCSVPIIFPDRLLTRTVEAVLPCGKLGVLMPSPGQMEWMRGRWTTPQRSFVGAAASPYSAAAELSALASSLAGEGADLIVLDCMGFDRAMKRTVVEATGLPVIQANRLVGRVVEELVTM